MSSKKTSIPEAPQFQTDPNVGWSQDKLKGQYDYLINGLTGSGELSGALGDSINVSPLVSQYSQQLAKAQLDPQYRVQRQNLINTLEANNQLNSSTTASSLGNLEADYMSSLTGMQAQYGLADVERALNNRVQLYGMGLNTAQSVGSAGLNNQQQMNQFALANYENQVAAALMNQKSGGWSWGGMISGAVSGAAAGSSAGPYGMLAGGVLGGVGGGLGGDKSSSTSNGIASLSGYFSKNTSPTTYSSGSESIYDVTKGYQPLSYANLSSSERRF